MAKTRIKLKKQRKYRGRRKASFYRPTPAGALGPSDGAENNNNTAAANGNNASPLDRKDSMKEMPSGVLSIHRSSFNPSSSDYFGMHSSSGFYSSSTTTTTDGATTATNITIGSTDEKVSPNSLSPLAIVMPEGLGLPANGAANNNTLTACGSAAFPGSAGAANNANGNDHRPNDVKRFSVHQFYAFQQQKQADMCDRYVRKAAATTQYATVKAIVEEEETTTSSSSNAAVITVTVPLAPLPAPAPGGEKSAEEVNVEIHNQSAPPCTVTNSAGQLTQNNLPADNNNSWQGANKESIDTTEIEEDYEDEEDDDEDEDEDEEMDEEEEDDEDDGGDEEQRAMTEHRLSFDGDSDKESSGCNNNNQNELKLKVISTNIDESAAMNTLQPRRKSSLRVTSSITSGQATTVSATSTSPCPPNSGGFIPRKSSIVRRCSFRNGHQYESCGSRSMTPNSEEEDQHNQQQQQQQHRRTPSIRCCSTSPTATSTAASASSSATTKNSVRIKKLKFRNKITRYGSSSRESKQESKAAKTLTIITGIFICCWLPFFVLALVMPLCTDCVINKYLFDFCLWLGWANSSVNPVLYTIFSPDFRNAFKRLIYGRRRQHRRRQQQQLQPKKNGLA